MGLGGGECLLGGALGGRDACTRSGVGVRQGSGGRWSGGGGRTVWCLDSG